MYTDIVLLMNVSCLYNDITSFDELAEGVWYKHPICSYA